MGLWLRMYFEAQNRLEATSLQRFSWSCRPCIKIDGAMKLRRYFASFSSSNSSISNSPFQHRIESQFRAEVTGNRDEINLETFAWFCALRWTVEAARISGVGDHQGPSLCPRKQSIPRYLEMLLMLSSVSLSCNGETVPLSLAQEQEWISRGSALIKTFLIHHVKWFSLRCCSL